MGYDVSVALIWGVRVDPNISDAIIWKLFGNEIREYAFREGRSLEEAFENYVDNWGQDMDIPETPYRYVFLTNAGYDTGIFIVLSSSEYQVLRTSDETMSHKEPTPLQIERFLEFLGSHGIGVGGQGDLPVSEYGLWTVPVNQ